jgi:hypothetical protein
MSRVLDCREKARHVIVTRDPFGVVENATLHSTKGCEFFKSRPTTRISRINRALMGFVVGSYSASHDVLVIIPFRVVNVKLLV